MRLLSNGFQDRLVMTASISLHKYDAQVCIIFMETDETRLDEQRSSNPLRIPHPKFDKLACQAQGAGIFAKGEISLRDAYCTYLILNAQVCIIFMEADETWLDEQRSSNPLRIPHPKFDKLACQAQGAGIFAKGEISLRDAYCTYLNATLSVTRIFYHTFPHLSRANLSYFISVVHLLTKMSHFGIMCIQKHIIGG